MTIVRRRYKREDGKTIYPIDAQYQLLDCGQWSPFVLGLMGYGSHKQSFVQTQLDFEMYLGSKISSTAIQTQSERIGAFILNDAKKYLPEPPTEKAKMIVVMLDGGMLHVGKEVYKEVKGALIQRINSSNEMEELRFANCCSLDEFLPLFKSYCKENGLFHAENFVVIGDCGAFIDTIHAQLFPTATRIADIFHAKEYLVKALQLIANNRPVKDLPEYELWKGLLESGNIPALIECLEKLAKEVGERKQNRSKNILQINKRKCTMKTTKKQECQLVQVQWRVVFVM